MRSSKSFVRGSADFASQISLLMGLSLGLATSGCVMDPDVSQDEQGLTLQGAELRADVVGLHEIPTGGVCSNETGRFRCMTHAQMTENGRYAARIPPAGAAPA